MKCFHLLEIIQALLTVSHDSLQFHGFLFLLSRKHSLISFRFGYQFSDSLVLGLLLLCTVDPNQRLLFATGGEFVPMLSSFRNLVKSIPQSRWLHKILNLLRELPHAILLRFLYFSPARISHFPQLLQLRDSLFVQSSPVGILRSGSEQLYSLLALRLDRRINPAETQGLQYLVQILDLWQRICLPRTQPNTFRQNKKKNKKKRQTARAERQKHPNKPFFIS